MKETKFEKAVNASFEDWSAKIDEEEKKYRFRMLRIRSGMNLKQFSKYFKIPYRTIQHWDAGDRKCPEYLLELIEYKLTKEKLIKGFDDFMNSIDK